MTHWAKLSTLLILAASAQGACVAKDLPGNCVATGSTHISGAPSSDEVCAAFMRELEAALGNEGASYAVDDASVTLTISKRGSISAAIVFDAASDREQPDEIVMDVMDRQLAMKDLQALAEAMAKVLTDQ